MRGNSFDRERFLDNDLNRSFDVVRVDDAFLELESALERVGADLGRIIVTCGPLYLKLFLAAIIQGHFRLCGQIQFVKCRSFPEEVFLVIERLNGRDLLVGFLIRDSLEVVGST